MTPEEIKAVRLRLGLTQTQLATELGTQQATVSNWEKGKHPISKPFVKLLEIIAAKGSASVWIEAGEGTTLNENGTVSEVADQSTKPKRRKL